METRPVPEDLISREKRRSPVTMFTRYNFKALVTDCFSVIQMDLLSSAQPRKKSVGRSPGTGWGSPPEMRRTFMLEPEPLKSHWSSGERYAPPTPPVVGS